MTLRPKHLECFKSKVASHSIRTIILFEKHEHAQKWNKMHEDRIRKSGHLGTLALVALVISIGGSPTVSFAMGAGSGIIKDEVQAQVWFPEMFKGWVLTRHFNFSYEQYPNQHFLCLGLTSSKMKQARKLSGANMAKFISRLVAISGFRKGSFGR